MAYFNHAFEKAFLGTGVTRQTGSEDPDALPNFTASLLNGTTLTVQTAGGFVTTNNVPTYVLNQLKADAPSTYTDGYFGIFDPKQNVTITPDSCCNVYIAGSAIYENEKLVLWQVVIKRLTSLK